MEPFPLQSSKFSFEYLLLPPRSALGAVRPGITPKASCYTLLSGFRLPWPPSGCLDELTPFVVSDERVFRHLNLAFGSSRIASSAYQKWPTNGSISLSPLYPNSTIDLHVRTAASLHQSFLWLRPIQA
ncbi:hypothetical protein P175DRAFT_0546100 [Aspergillus ochraceoroseus IBT 24754]|uniref:Uncharacterized protein n=1 Tax=Aspergillus ochraceoroseus IBT 24754 TaxID=1392256 RepID=A0A2T5LKG7_9EURO|nr:hypothetical protein P175DRAFT_0546100 [Aspergillus ochraceoroseus IBT 24754]